MTELKLFYAEVVDNDDSTAPDGKKLSRIKVRLLPEMKDIVDSYLPWVRPFLTGGMSPTNFNHNPPEIDSKVWCLFTDYTFHTGYYLSGAFIDGFFQFTTIDTSLADITETVATTYPNLKFYLFKDGTILFENSSNGDVGIYQSSGSYIFIKSTGAIYAYSKAQELKIYNDNAKIEIKSDGEANLENSSGHLKLTSAGVVNASGNTKSLVTHAELNTALQNFMTALNLHVHTGVTTGPSSSGTPTPMTLDISTAQSQKYKEQ